MIQAEDTWVDPIPTLIPTGWTQQAGEINLLYARVRVTAPASCPTETGNVTVDFLLDGQFIGEFHNQGGSHITVSMDEGTTEALEMGFLQSITGSSEFSHAMFEPGAGAIEHTLTARAMSWCSGTVFGEISMDVVEIA